MSQPEQANSYKLADSFSLFFYDFKLNKNYKDYPIFNLLNSIWKRSTVKPDEIFLFNHVKDFFLKNVDKTNNAIDENHCIIYELKKDNLSVDEKKKLFLFNSFFNKTHSWQDKDGSALQFKILNDASILSPKIFISPLTSVGILTFGFQLTPESNTLQNLIQFNYAVKIFRAGQVANFFTSKNPHPKAQEQEQQISNALSLFSEEKKQPNENHNWNIQLLSEYLLQDFEQGSIEEVSHSRLQAFIYAQTENKLDGQKLHEALFRLRKLYNFNYTPPIEEMKDSKEVVHPFEQIYLGSSVEGAVIFLNEYKEKLPEFLKNFGEVLKRRYIWTYLLAYHQRIALIIAAEETSQLYAGNIEPEISTLSTLVNKLAKIQLKCMFNEVSHYTQQNDFYYLCRDTMRLPSLFEELKSELEELSALLQEKHIKSEEQSAKVREEKEREREKRLSLLIGILIVPQVWYAMINSGPDWWRNVIQQNETTVNILTALVWLLLIGVAVKLFFVKKKKS